MKTHWRVALGEMQTYLFLPETAYAEVICSTRLQLLTYAAAIALSIAIGHPWVLVQNWLLPLAIGQPILRFILLAEHTGCTHDANPFTNTRTTLTLFPLRFMMWNLPFHTEHHLYPSIPFHAPPSAHQHLKAHFTPVESGYVKVDGEIVAAFRQPVL
jgi:fatty acid desaturase